MAANEPGQPHPVIAGVPDYSIDLATPTSALAIGAHPDDVEFGCGGLLAKWAADGCVVHHLVCTDGSKGTWDADADVVALAARRQDEQREADRVAVVTGPIRVERRRSRSGRGHGDPHRDDDNCKRRPQGAVDTGH
mgnify:CR=1 FL=1